MFQTFGRPLGRREFLALSGLAAVLPERAVAAESRAHVSIVIDRADPICASQPVAWGLGRLVAALRAKGVTVAEGRASADHTVLISRQADADPEDVLVVNGARPGETHVRSGGARGLAYGLNEMAERVDAAADPIVALHLDRPLTERPATPVRSILRAFSSVVDDKTWLYDKDGWNRYLDLLVASRFNRLNLTLGLAYDFPRGVTEDYLHFAYPYLLTVPGYDVFVEPLPTGERERNLDALKYVSSQAAARGLDFQLGIWTHAYKWVNSPKAEHRITGLTPANHAAYCRDALALLLRECPGVTGLTLRIHGESGVPEGSYDFWRTVFEAIRDCDRPIEIDMHAKGVNDIMVDMAVATGKAVKISPKFSAEHQSLGYHQADIRPEEIPDPSQRTIATFAVSEGSRTFTRYGYADLYREGRKYEILHRRWPGTQRHTLSGDPVQAAAYGRAATFCGSAGLEYCEPMMFKGRNGSGSSGGRLCYVDEALETSDAGWEKFAYSYRLWGRLLYDPKADPEAWRRPLRKTFGDAAPAMEKALAEASRILLTLTTAHLPSAANRFAWYENYVNIPLIASPDIPLPYLDKPLHKKAGPVGALDHQLFSSPADHVSARLSGAPATRYSPIEVATWMELCVENAERALEEGRRRIGDRSQPEFRRWEEDILIQIGLGRFFADKFRATVLYEIFERSGDADAGRQAVERYQAARDAWAAMAERAKAVYRPDIGYGEPYDQRLHWAARVPDMDKDLTRVRAAVATANPKASSDRAVRAAVAEALGVAPRRRADCKHTPAERFDPGAALTIEMSADAAVQTAELWYRHVNHAERWRSTPMQRKGRTYRAEIPAAYTDSPFPLQYYFVVSGGRLPSTLYPGFDAAWSNQPYYAVWRRATLSKPEPT